MKTRASRENTLPLDAFGDSLRMYARRRRLSYAQIATHCRFSVDTIKSWANGGFPRREIGKDHVVALQRLCAFLDLSDEERVAFITQAQLKPEVEAHLIGTRRVAEPPVAHVRILLRPTAEPFVGRAHELTHIRDYLDPDSRVAPTPVVLIVGMPGSGKTALAISAAQTAARPAAYPDGTLLVALDREQQAGTTVEALVAALRALKLPTASSPNGDSAALQAQYHAALAGRRLLIIADNVTTEAQAQALLPPPDCALIVTSRQRLAQPSGLVIDLGVLSGSESVLLIRKVCPRLSDDDAQVVARHYGFHPQACALAAQMLARQAAMSVRQHLAFAGLPGDIVPDDHAMAALWQSFHAALQQVSPEHRRTLHLLSVFDEPFTRSDATTIVPITRNLLITHLAELEMYSLLVYDHDDDSYRIHPVLHALLTAQRVSTDTNWQITVRVMYTHYGQQLEQLAADLLLDATTSTAVLIGFDNVQHHIDRSWRLLIASPPDASTGTWVPRYVDALLSFTFLAGRYSFRTATTMLQAACDAIQDRVGVAQETALLFRLIACAACIGDQSATRTAFTRLRALHSTPDTPTGRATLRLVASVIADIDQQTMLLPDVADDTEAEPSALQEVLQEITELVLPHQVDAGETITAWEALDDRERQLRAQLAHARMAIETKGYIDVQIDLATLLIQGDQTAQARVRLASIVQLLAERKTQEYIFEAYIKIAALYRQLNDLVRTEELLVQARSVARQQDKSFLAAIASIALCMIVVPFGREPDARRYMRDAIELMEQQVVRAIQHGGSSQQLQAMRAELRELQTSIATSSGPPPVQRLRAMFTRYQAIAATPRSPQLPVGGRIKRP